MTAIKVAAADFSGTSASPSRRLAIAGEPWQQCRLQAAARPRLRRLRRQSKRRRGRRRSRLRRSALHPRWRRRSGDRDQARARRGNDARVRRARDRARLDAPRSRSRQRLRNGSEVRARARHLRDRRRLSVHVRPDRRSWPQGDEVPLHAQRQRSERGGDLPDDEPGSERSVSPVRAGRCSSSECIRESAHAGGARSSSGELAASSACRGVRPPRPRGTFEPAGLQLSKSLIVRW